jgi:hypothetical protein
MKTLPELLILVSPQMKKDFEQFGQWCSIDATYNMMN